MNDRWARAEERYRQRTEELRYRRSDYDWGDAERAPRGRGARHAASTDEWDDYEDDTTVIPRYTDDQEPPVRPTRPVPGRAPARDVEGDRGRRARSADWDTDEQPWDAEDHDWEADPRTREWRADHPEWDDADHEDWEDEDHAPDDVPARKGGARGRSDERESGRAGRGRSGRGQSRGRRSRAASRKAAERKRRRRNLLILGCVFAVLFVAAGGYAGYKLIGKLGGPEDFAGPAGPATVVQVRSGDTAEQIAQTMAGKGVVASTGAFYEAAVHNPGMTSVQPGYYAVPTHSKGVDAVAALLDKKNRVGNVVIPEGKRLRDSFDVTTGARNQGIYGMIADASCMGTGAEKKCVTAEQLDAAGASTDLAALGVPAWALDAVRRVPDRSHQLEGLIAAGTLDFDPTGSPTQILNQLITQSASRYESTGLLQAGGANGMNPYQTLIAASLVEREARPNDMSKVARVIVNRLAANEKLEFDSTVNYNLDRTEVATTDADRARETPWNTYAMTGLPATPISSPSLEALRAMEEPAPGPWRYFVTVDKQGTTLFTDSYSEHLRNVVRAQQSGILDSGKGN
ncbi:endolytic transglycosylase MltG [Nocardia sp. CDC159]|uniref:Endolytic murein transglycosylase n=1 Tax=Nocardia pulmonis TaxID=2951408 RepID=A0A9X2IWV5_9NOCA|nr:MULTISPECIES: endolytic transglycosylase MltG [Nocardia]MCM6774743.1 endolytic transglycosylase MltG [Nocardia pulmonis]MCM6787192.1 endolytic transglycosylase MltG [Nocardia sp. CDC159]